MSEDRLKAKGSWSLEIYGECPNCKEIVDFASADNFFTEATFEPIGPVDGWHCRCPKCDCELSLDVEEGI